MPLSAHEQRVLAAVEDELNRHDTELADLFARAWPPPSGPSRIGARWAAVPVALAVWVLITALTALAGLGVTNAALIVVALGMLVGAHVARFLARRALYQRVAAGAASDRFRHHED